MPNQPHPQDTAPDFFDPFDNLIQILLGNSLHPTSQSSILHDFWFRIVFTSNMSPSVSPMVRSPVITDVNQLGFDGWIHSQATTPNREAEMTNKSIEDGSVDVDETLKRFMPLAIMVGLAPQEQVYEQSPSPKDGDCGYTCVAWSSGQGRGISTPELIRKLLSAELKKDKKMYEMIGGKNINEEIRNTQPGESAGVTGWLKMPLFGYAIANHLKRLFFEMAVTTLCSQLQGHGFG
ncbi:hypothetical protein BY996DRAFT_6470165 [Phakopsora pachyrhizi]|nr:hypothetical protein BY996DRAFT_6470165 [Phakopsora pachyrhizi]